MEEIYRLISEGHSIEVNDSKTGEDITTRVLAQLILEQAPGKWAALPAELFHQLIRANDSLLHEFVDKYFHRALLAFEKSQHEFDQYLRHALGLSHQLMSMNPAPWGANWAEMMLAPFMRTFLADGSAPTSPPTKPRNTEDTGLKAELDQLKQQVEDLRKELRQH